jgi:hypothetical protein
MQPLATRVTAPLYLVQSMAIDNEWEMAALEVSDKGDQEGHDADVNTRPHDSTHSSRSTVRPRIVNQRLITRSPAPSAGSNNLSTDLVFAISVLNPLLYSFSLRLPHTSPSTSLYCIFVTNHTTCVGTWLAYLWSEAIRDERNHLNDRITPDGSHTYRPRSHACSRTSSSRPSML